MHALLRKCCSSFWKNLLPLVSLPLATYSIFNTMLAMDAALNSPSLALPSHIYLILLAFIVCSMEKDDYSTLVKQKTYVAESLPISAIRLVIVTKSLIWYETFARLRTM